MRRILFLALAVVLVFQGLMGSAMAAGASAPLPVQDAALWASASPGAHGEGHPAADPAPCHDTSAHGCQPLEHGASSGCTACDICHSAALVPPALPAQSKHLRGALRSADAIAFASVPAARTIKPPIA
ncbi:MAG: hypothetical protein RBS27_08340 [Giesbergeria sp.]|jgi:hypothetical protein|nr:hypothetical protein [Giesbergeria sp.]